MQTRPDRRALKEKTRADLLAAAKRLFSERPYSEVTLVEIFGEVGKRLGGSSNLFKSKADLYAQAMGAPAPVDDPEKKAARRRERSRRRQAQTSRQAQRERTRAKALETARRLFNENAYDRVSLRRIFSELGMTTGAFYASFESKEDLWVQAMGTPPPGDRAATRHADELQAKLRELVSAVRSGADLEPVLSESERLLRRLDSGRLR